MSYMDQAREAFHRGLVESGVLSLDSHGIASNADRSQKSSVEIAKSIACALGANEMSSKLKGQTVGKLFEEHVASYVESTMTQLHMLRPGKWHFDNVGSSRKNYHIAEYLPYTHLADLSKAIKENLSLRSAIGNSYDISPDILVLREPESDEYINLENDIISKSSEIAKFTPIRKSINSNNIVHAVISCKWTLRSDRAQNARSEALNIIRNRKGRTPHIMVVTGEPSPARIASLALGTGDIDMIYHFALHELEEAVKKSGNSEAQDMMDTLVKGSRLRDISDLPFDLTI